jgi:3-phosphoshikimate 1-carboxyvinyltransferase
MSSIEICPFATPPHGELRVPGDKSGSHRALMLSALADGTSKIVGLSQGHDVAATSRILCQLGATRRDEGADVYITGPTEGLKATDDTLDCENSGTTIRLLSGIVSGIEGEHRLVGDDSLSRRPMDRVAIPLNAMGSHVTGRGEKITAPLNILGSSQLRAIDYEVPKPSAQVKSAVLFAGLRANGPVTVRESIRTRATTEDMMRLVGLSVISTDVGAGRVVTLEPGRPVSRQWLVPGDPSQAAFFCVLGAIAEDADVRIMDVENAPERIGFIHVLRRMGAQVEEQNAGTVSHFRVTSSPLMGTSIHSSEIPSVDEVPILTVAACAANGVSEFLDMGELRLKESDRFATSIMLAESLGARVWSEGDDFFVEGRGSARGFSHFTFNAGLDHRLVMSSAIAGVAGNGCIIENPETVQSSYPNFFEHLESLR